MKIDRLTGLLVLAISACSAVSAQTAEPTAMDVLARVRENYANYLQTVPNLIADEHLATGTNWEAVPISTTGRNVEADSTFTLRRKDAVAGKLPVLTEQREIKTVDHKPATAETDLNTPVMFSGAFSYAAGFLLPELARCYDYKLKTHQTLKRRPVLLIEYASKSMSPSDCPVRERASGRAFLDPETMHIVRLEQTRPHHLLEGLAPTPNNETEAEVTWAWTIDYIPVTLDNRTLWLANTVSSKMNTNSTDARARHESWTFLANYQNYRLLAVHSKILPMSSQ